MTPQDSIQRRSLFSIVFNIVRSAASFFTSLVVARELGPENFGHFAFIIGTVLSLKPLLELGSSSAFFTFVSQQKAPLYLIKRYSAWLLALFTSVALLFWVNPFNINETIWLKTNTHLILFGWTALFAQHFLWVSVIQIGDALAETSKVQLINLCVAIVHLLAILGLSFFDTLDVLVLFKLIAIEYILASFIMIFWLPIRNPVDVHSIPDWKNTFRSFWIYSSPLIVYGLASFASSFIDTWYLYKHRGAEEQAFLSINNQLSSISLLFTSAILGVLWREIAQAKANKKIRRIEVLYKKSNHFTYFVSCLIACFLATWSVELIEILLGSSYRGSAKYFLVLLFFPMHQSLGQMTATLFYATEATGTYTRLGIFFLVINALLSILILSPEFLNWSGYAIALKTVVFQILTVNISILIVSRKFHWKFDWLYQILDPLILLPIAIGSAQLIKSYGQSIPVALQIVCHGILYAVLAAILLWINPKLFQFRRKDLDLLIAKMRKKQDIKHDF